MLSFRCNGATFRDWYRVERERLLTSMALLLGDVEEAHAVTEETFGRALRGSGPRARDAPERSWLYSRARRRAGATRRRRRLLRRVDASAGWRAVIPPEHSEVWHGVLRLSPEVREVVVLCAVAGFAVQEVSGQLRMPLVAVHANLWIGLREVAAAPHDTNAKPRDPKLGDAETADVGARLRALGDAAGVVPEIPGLVAEHARARRSRRKTIVALAVLVLIVLGVPPLLMFQSGAFGAGILRVTLRSANVPGAGVIHRVVLWRSTGGPSYVRP
ncbi:MAG: hypothetical protein JOZ99_09950 [Actinobacteria bacterium]|nr:hypothetical protein [Actinomycetota bacterium]